jgi:hypothetical protein
MLPLLQICQIVFIDFQLIVYGVYVIVAGLWGHQPGQTAVVGALTDHSFKMKATIWNELLRGTYY